MTQHVTISQIYPKISRACRKWINSGVGIVEGAPLTRYVEVMHVVNPLDGLSDTQTARGISSSCFILFKRCCQVKPNKCAA